MRHLIRFGLGAVVAVVLVVVMVQTGSGQGGSNPSCPFLRTDPFGFPLNPPYSEYPSGNSGDLEFYGIDVFKVNLPCCGIIDFAADPPVIAEIVPADGTLETCIPPSTNLTELGPFPGFLNPYSGRNCPAVVTTNLTLEDATGAVRNCNPAGSDIPTGGSNFLILVGANAG